MARATMANIVIEALPWLGRAIYGPMPSTEGLPVEAREEIQSALLDDHPKTLVALVVVGVLAVPGIVIGLLVLRRPGWTLGGVGGLVTALIGFQVVTYGRERSAVLAIRARHESGDAASEERSADPPPDPLASDYVRRPAAQRHRAVLDVLRQWDPIGVADDEPREYDVYAPDVIRLLDAGVSRGEMIDHLTRLARDQMGLTGVARRHTAACADALIAIWEESEGS